MGDGQDKGQGPFGFIEALGERASSTADFHEVKSCVALPPGRGPSSLARQSVISPFQSTLGVDGGVARLYASADGKVQQTQPACEVGQVRNMRPQDDLSGQGPGLKLQAGGDSGFASGNALQPFGDECALTDSTIGDMRRICHSSTDADSPPTR